MEIKKTSLNKLHQKYQAKFVEFAGYEMPIQYKEGIIEEHKFTRNQSGIFDVSHMGQLFIYGKEDLVEDLEKIFPLDLKNLKLNHSKYSFLMNDEAGIYDDLIITRIKDGYLIILNAACKDQDFKIIKEKLDNNYEMTLNENLSLIAIQGPDAKNVLEKVIPNIRSTIKFTRIISPLDLENEFGLTQGNLNHGEMTLDQFMFMRPTISSSQYQTPINNLYLCGAGTHPGGGLHGTNGFNAAREVLKK